METLSYSSNEKGNNHIKNKNFKFSINGVRYSFIKSSEVSKVLRELTECFAKDSNLTSNHFYYSSICEQEKNTSQDNYIDQNNSIKSKNDSSSSELSISTLTTSMESQNLELPYESKTYICQTCGKCFPKRDFLQKHKIVHEAPKHRCVICDKCFMREDKLKRHFLSIHSKHRPHVCQTCSKAFARKDKLKDHLKHHITAGDNFRCCECRISFVQKSDLNRHSRLVHGGRKIETTKNTRSKPNTNKASTTVPSLSTSSSSLLSKTCGHKTKSTTESPTTTLSSVSTISSIAKPTNPMTNTSVDTSIKDTYFELKTSSIITNNINNQTNNLSTQTANSNSTALYAPIMMLSSSSVNPFTTVNPTTGLLVAPTLSLFPNLPLKMPSTIQNPMGSNNVPVLTAPISQNPTTIGSSSCDTNNNNNNNNNNININTPTLSNNDNITITNNGNNNNSNSPIALTNSTITTTNTNINSNNNNSSNISSISSLSSTFTTGYMNYRFPNCQIPNTQISPPASNVKKETTLINPVQSPFYPHLHAAVINPFPSTNSMIPVFPHYLSSPNHYNQAQLQSQQPLQQIYQQHTQHSQSQQPQQLTTHTQIHQPQLHNTQQQQQQQQQQHQSIHPQSLITPAMPNQSSYNPQYLASSLHYTPNTTNVTPIKNSTSISYQNPACALQHSLIKSEPYALAMSNFYGHAAITNQHFLHNNITAQINTTSTSTIINTSTTLNSTQSTTSNSSTINPLTLAMTIESAATAASIIGDKNHSIKSGLNATTPVSGGSNSNCNNIQINKEPSVIILPSPNNSSPNIAINTLTSNNNNNNNNNSNNININDSIINTVTTNNIKHFNNNIPATYPYMPF